MKTTPVLTPMTTPTISVKGEQRDEAVSCGKIVCVGRNYAAHAAELNNPVPDTPILFIKPATALCTMSPQIQIPKGRGSVHHEVEIALLVGQTLSHSSPLEARQGICAVGLALDLTLRDLQTELKQKGLPWERAKSFDGACPVTPFYPLPVRFWSQPSQFELQRNHQVQQQGRSDQMLFAMDQLVAFMSTQFTLLPGDLILTGTPAGVGPLAEGDQLQLSLDDYLTVTTQVSHVNN